ncbi:MAG: phage holin family protein, partial [Promethearchaeota archaeon]
MFNLVLRWIINSCALMIVTYLVPGIEIRNFYSALIAVL